MILVDLIRVDCFLKGKQLVYCCAKQSIRKKMYKSSCSGGSQQDASSSQEEAQKTNSLEKKHKASNWTEEETKCFIDFCIEKRIIQMMDGKRHKHIDIYNSLEPRMKEMGFIKSGAQMKTKLKHLKEMYFKCKRNNNTSSAGRQTFAFYDAMEQLFGGRPSVQAIANIGIDSSSNIIQERTEEEAFEVQDNVEPILQDEIKDYDDNTPPLKKLKTRGRNTHLKLTENFAEIFAKKQGQEMQKVMRMFDDTINTQMENQRQWEKEMIEKEHQHQFLLLENFMKGLGTTQTANFQYPQFAPTSIPVHPSTSAHNLYSYQLSPSPLLCSSTSSSSFPSPLPSPTFINSPATNISMPSPTSNSSQCSVDSVCDKSKHI